MSDAVAAPAPAQTKAEAAPKKKSTKPKTPASHPKYNVMIAAAITSLKERGGSSRQAILKYILANYKLGSNTNAANSHLKMALKAGVKGGTLKQAKGTGASGSFRLGEKKVEKKSKKKAAKKAKSPKKTAKPKKATKPKKAKSPKKAKKPAAPKAKKAAKPKAAKKPAAKKAAKPKSPAKKAGKKPAKKAAAKK